MGSGGCRGPVSACKAWWANRAVKWTITVLWLGVNAVLLWRSFLYYKMDPKFFYLHEMLGAGLCTSRATASLINLNLGMLLLPVCRLVTSFLRNPNFRFSKQTVRTVLDKAKGFHELCAWLLTISSVVHFCGHFFNAYNFSVHYSFRFKHINAAAYKGQNPLFLVLNSLPGITGLLLTAILLLLISTATLRVRRSNYNLFWYSHKLFVAFYIIVLLHAFRGILTEQVNLSEHVPGCIYLNLSDPTFDHSDASFDPWPEPEPEPEPIAEIPVSEWKCSEDPEFAAIGSSSWMWVTGPMIVYIIDSMYRYIYSWHHPVSVVSVHLHPPRVIEIRMHRNGFSCRPGQFILIRCPEISNLEWHPFTVSKCPSKNDPNFFIHVRSSGGDWSARLFDYLSQPSATTHILHPVATAKRQKIYIDGPFASPMEDVLRYRFSLCVAGGIGITPFAAILDHIRRDPDAVMTRRLHLIWMSREVELFLSFAKLLCDTHQQLWTINRPDVFSFQLYITSSTDQAVVQNLLEAEYGLLARRIVFGRPNWTEVLGQVASSRRRETVGVFSCGPKSLNAQLARICTQGTIHRTIFEFFHESL